MKARKVTALLLAAVMILSMAGCTPSTPSASTDQAGKETEKVSSEQAETKSEDTAQDSGNGVTFPLADEKEYSVFAIMDNSYDLKDNPVIKKFTEEANIKFNFNSVMGADLLEKRNLVLASGDYPDVFYKTGLNLNDLDKYGKQGIFVPLEDLIKEYAPNLTAKLDELAGWDYITAGDGHIYSLPEIQRPLGATPTYWINKKWMDTLDLKEPTNLDGLYTVLKAFKDEDLNGNGDANDEIPITATDVVKPDLLLNYFGISYDYQSKLSVIDGTLTYVPTSDVFKEYIAYITKLYQEGILDKNAFTQKHEQQGAIGQSGDVFGSFFDAGAFLTVGRDNDDDYIALTPFEDGKYALASAVVPGTLAITDACENPEIIIAWADQFYSEEGGIYAWLGIENETWEMKDDGTWGWIVGNGYGDDISSVRAQGTIQGAANHPSIQPDFWYDKMSPEIDPDEVYLNGERNKISSKGAVALPMMRYNEEDSLTIATLKTDVDAYIDQYVAQVATGKLDLESSWDDYVKTVNNMGVSQLSEIYEKAYQEAISK